MDLITSIRSEAHKLKKNKKQPISLHEKLRVKGRCTFLKKSLNKMLNIYL